jgi:hypothetical protein
MQLNPKYSVIIPVYNRRAVIADAIRSVLNQTCDDYEIIVCDDGSTDGTYEMVSRIDPRIRLIQTPRRGAGGARNAAAAVARGEFLSFLDSDDVWAPWTLRCVDAVVRQTHGAASVFLKPCYSSFAEAEVLGKFDGSCRWGLFPSFVHAPTKMPYGGGLLAAIRKDFFDSVGGFSEEKTNAEDRDLALKLNRICGYAVIESPVCILYRAHAGQLTQDHESSIMGWRLISKNYESGTYGPQTDPVLAAYMVMFFADRVEVLLAKGQPGCSAWFFLRSFTRAAIRFQQERGKGNNKVGTIRTAAIVIRRFAFSAPLLLLFSVINHLAGRTLEKGYGWLKEPEHNVYQDALRRLGTLRCDI